MDRSNQRWLWAAGGIIALAAVAILGVVLFGGSNDDGLVSTVDDTTTTVGPETTTTEPLSSESSVDATTTAPIVEPVDTDAASPDSTNAPTATSPRPTIVSTTTSTVSNGVPTLWDVIVGDPDLSAFRDAITTAQLVDLFDGPEPVTAFIPVNDAFQQYLADTDGAELLPDDVAEIVRRHVVSGELSAATLFGQTSLTALSGEQLVVDSGALTVDGASLLRTDIRAVGGVLHVVNAVLVAPGT